MSSFDELENLYERYNYNQMDLQELRELVRRLCTDREVLMHFMIYETYREMIKEK